MGKITYFFNRTYSYIFALLFLFVPFDEYVRALPNILLIVLSIGFFFIIKKTDLKKLTHPAILLFSGLLVFIVLNSLIMDRWDANASILKKILISGGILVLALPLRGDRLKVSLAIVISILVANIISLYKIAILIWKTGTFEFANSQNAIDALVIDRLYMGFFAVLSTVLCYYLLGKLKKAYQLYLWLNIGLNVLFVYVVSSRIAIIIFFTLVLLQQFYRPKVWKRILIALIGFGLITSVAFLLNNNLDKRFFYSKKDNQDQGFIDKALALEPRTVIWSCAVNIGKSEEVFWVGKGFDNVRNSLVECYENYIEHRERRGWFLGMRYNPHNQFLDFYLSTGILAVSLFISIFIFLFIKKRREFFPVALLVSIALFGFIESYFYRQMGGYYFGIILVLIIFDSKFFSLPENEGDSKKEGNELR